MTAGRKMVLALALVLPAAAAFSQQGTTALTTARPRSSYDPAAKAGASTDTTSAMEKALHTVNPQDKDYGAALDSVRLSAIQETFENLLWWIDLVLAVGFTLSMAGNYWQHRRSEDRLRISSAIVAQLYNSHIASRSKALEAIAKHNKLADLYNAKCDDEARLRLAQATAEQQRSSKGENEAATKVAEQQSPGTRAATRPQIQPETSASSSEAEQTPAGAEVLSEAEEIKRLKAQLVAKEQKINNLRSQVNRAHTTLEQERKRVVPAVQA